METKDDTFLLVVQVGMGRVYCHNIKGDYELVEVPMDEFENYYDLATNQDVLFGMFSDDVNFFDKEWQGKLYKRDRRVNRNV